MSASAERWSIVRAVFEELVELPADQRPARLQARCGADAELRRAVERLLEADRDAAQALAPERLAAGVVGIDPLAQAQGTRVGDFTVIRLLGSGGMGAVYEAEQHNPHRLVALKVLRPELCTGKTLQRFQVEAEILGRLQHQGIAEVYAAGVHRAEVGPFRWDMPYYAMQLLPAALPITEYARRLALPLAARLDLLAKVCQAAHHAHQRGVIHRDLKPANVLVDANGAPRIIDFGVARAQDHDAALTATGVLIGTPSYMAPEQIAGEDVDVRTDVWALGVLLYELVCGRLPYALDGRTPATQATLLQTSPPAPRTLCAEVSPELEWIMLAALSVDRARRYQTAAELADDLDRLRRHETVRAAPPSLAYRLRKAARRHRTLTVAAAVALVSLAAGLIATGLALRRAWRAETEARTAATAAAAAAQRAEVEKANAVAARTEAEANAGTALASKQRVDGLLQLIQSSVLAASRQGGGSVTLADLWQQIGDRVDHDPSLSDLVRAAALNYLGGIRFLSGDVAAAEQLFRRSLASLPASGADVAREEIMGRAALSEALRLQDRLDESESELQRALELGKSTLPADDADLLSLRRRLGFALLNRGRAPEAVAIYRELLAARLRDTGPTSRASAEAQLDLATALYASGDMAAAEPQVRVARAACAEAFGADSEKTLGAAHSQTLILLRSGHTDDALATARQAAETARGGLGDGHPLTRVLRRDVAAALAQAGDLPGAVAAYRACLEDATHARNATRREVLATVTSLAETLLRAEQAEAAVTATEPYAAPRPDEATGAYVELCAVQRARVRALRASGRAEQALDFLRAATGAALARLGDEHPACRAFASLSQELAAH